MDRRLLRLTFTTATVGEPIVYQMGLQFGLATNIVRANIGKDGGSAVLELVGDSADVARAVEWARGMGVFVESVQEELAE